mgnify:CR=1 FL=1
MIEFRDKTDNEHTNLLDQGKDYATRAAAPLAAVLLQLKHYTAQSINAEEEQVDEAREHLASITESIVAPAITELPWLVTAQSSWSVKVAPKLEVGAIKFAAARQAFEAALEDAALAATPRKSSCEIDLPLSAFARNAPIMDLGSTILCGVRFRFYARRGCNCAASMSKAAGTVEGVMTLSSCACGLEFQVVAEPVRKALGVLYKACGVRARAVDDPVTTRMTILDDECDDEVLQNNAGDKGLVASRLDSTSNISVSSDAKSKNEANKQQFEKKNSRATAAPLSTIN